MGSILLEARVPVKVDLPWEKLRCEESFSDGAGSFTFPSIGS